MKKILFTLFVITLLTSCSKEGKTESDELQNHCPVITALSVPPKVLSAFQTSYPNETAIIWFQKDTIGYCAYFIKQGNQRKLAEFTASGVFVSEKSDIDNDGNFEDSTAAPGSKTTTTTTVCECIVPE
ncbi:MAG: hypothetical protein KGL19_01340 [Bacteroidota bacterium]|nr:hypothetical protein [Bacteroidota bacterium]